jgi:hypothetical protein
LPAFENNSVPKAEELEKNRPLITFPDNFEIGISTNEFGLNITEKIYYDKADKKFRV